MASSSFAPVKKQGKEVSNVQLVRNEVCKPRVFKAISKSAIKGDLNGALFMILENVLIMNDTRSCYMCKIGEIGDYEIKEAYDKLCDNRVLKLEHRVVVDQGLVHALDFLQNFKVEWIKIVLG